MADQEPEESMINMSRFKLLSVDDLTSTTDAVDRHGGDNNDEETIGEDDLLIEQYRSDDDDCPIGDPLLEDGFGHLTKWRLSDLENELINHLEAESIKPKIKEKKLTKEEKLKLHNDRLEQYMKSALTKYNGEENLNGDLCFKFVEALKESFIVEGDIMFYQHFNFAATQTHTTMCLFFAEIIPNGETCDVTCCKLLQDDDNGRCFGCKNQGDLDLRHPSCESVYAGGHEDCICPFLLDTDSDEDDSD